jgi:hypothetical protein
VAVGIATIAERIAESRHDLTPAPPGTPRIGSRLPIGLWPSDGTERMVEHGPRGWAQLAGSLYHRATVVDDAALARVVVICDRPRRQQDARREIALEAHVLRGVYEPALIAAAWLHPLGAPVESRLRELAEFGIGDVARATLRAAAELDADPELTASWRRELGIDVVRPQVTDAIVAEAGAERRAKLWAVLLQLADERVAERHALRARA